MGVAFATSWGLFLAGFVLLSGGHLDELWRERLPWVALAMAPGMLGLLGLRYPRLLLPAGIVSIPMAFISFSLIGLPFLIPACFYLVAYGRATAPIEPVPSRVPAVLTSFVVLLLLVGAFLALLWHKDPLCTSQTVLPSGRVVEREYVPQGSVGSGSFSTATTTRSLGGGPSLSRSCTSDRITTIEKTTSIGLVALAIVAGTWMSKPKKVPSE
jgi:hypothetical protein